MTSPTPIGLGAKLSVAAIVLLGMLGGALIAAMGAALVGYAAVAACLTLVLAP